MYLDKRELIEVDLPSQISIAFNILNYNQGLVQFADSKANALLLINSIFIAAITPFTERLFQTPLTLALAGAFFLFSIISILFSLGVIMARSGVRGGSKPKTLIYYAHIIESNSPEGYVRDFVNVEAEKFHETLLSDIYIVSTIAASKFATYNHGQTMTLISSLLWLCTILCLVVC